MAHHRSRNRREDLLTLILGGKKTKKSRMCSAQRRSVRGLMFRRFESGSKVTVESHSTLHAGSVSQGLRGFDARSKRLGASSERQCLAWWYRSQLAYETNRDGVIGKHARVCVCRRWSLGVGASMCAQPGGVRSRDQRRRPTKARQPWHQSRQGERDRAPGGMACRCSRMGGPAAQKHGGRWGTTQRECRR